MRLEYLPGMGKTSLLTDLLTFPCYVNSNHKKRESMVKEKIIREREYGKMNQISLSITPMAKTV